MAAMKGGIVKYLFNRERGRCSITRTDDNAQILGEEKAAIPDKNQPCELSGQARKTTFLITFSPDRALIASTHGDHTVRITESSTGRCAHVLRGHPRSPWCVAFHPVSSDILASGCLGGEVRIWDLRGGGSEVWKSTSGNVISSLSFHPTEQLLVFAQGHEIHFWDWKDSHPCGQCRTANQYEKVRWVKFDRWGHHLLTGIANGSTVQRNDSLDEFGYSSLPPYSSERGRLREHYMRMTRAFGNHNRSVRERSSRPPWAEDVEVMEPRSPTGTDASFNIQGLDDARRYAGQVTSNSSRALRNAREYAAHITNDAVREALRRRQRELSERQGPSSYQDGRSSAADTDTHAPTSTRIGLLGIANRRPSQAVTTVSSSSSSVGNPAQQPAATVSSPDVTASPPDQPRSILLPEFSGPSAVSRACVRRRARNPTRTWDPSSMTSSAASPSSASTSSSAATTVSTSQSSLLRSFLSVQSVAYTSSTGVSMAPALYSTSGATASSSATPAPSSGPTTSSASGASSRALLSGLLTTIQSRSCVNKSCTVSGRKDAEAAGARRALNTSSALSNQDESAGSGERTTEPSASASLSVNSTNNDVTDTNNVAHSTDSLAQPQDTSTTVMSVGDSRRGVAPNTNASRQNTSREDSSSDSDTTNTCGVGCAVCRGMPPSLRPDPLSMSRRLNRRHRMANRGCARLGRRGLRRRTPVNPPQPAPPLLRVERTQTLTSYIDSEVRRALGQTEEQESDSSESATELPRPAPTALIMPPSVGTSGHLGASSETVNVPTRSRHSSSLRSELQRLREGISDLDREIHDLYTWRQRQMEARMEALRSSFEQRRQDRQSRIEERLRLETSGSLGRRARAMRAQRAHREREAFRERYRDVMRNQRRQIPQITVTQASPEADESVSTAPHNPTHWRRWHPDMLEDRQAAQNRGEDRVWHSYARRNLHHDYNPAAAAADNPTAEDGFQQAINRAIAGAFMGTGDSAVASNIGSLTYRIQRWSLADGNLPDITNSGANVIVSQCKLNNDASIDVSQDGKLLAVLVPSPRGFPDNSVMAVFSLTEDTLSQCLYTKSFGPNAVSVSISPLNNYMLVGLAAKRLQWVFTPKQMVAQVYKLKTKGAGEDSMEHICDLMHPCDLDIRTRVGVNLARWMPGVGEGIIYGTNRGDLHICRPGDNEKDVKDRGVPGPDGSGEPGLHMQWLRLQMLGMGEMLNTTSTATQTGHGVRRSASTQTEGAVPPAGPGGSPVAPQPVPPPDPPQPNHQAEQS